MNATALITQYIAAYEEGVADAQAHGDEMDQRANRACLDLLKRIEAEDVTDAFLAEQIALCERNEAEAKVRGDAIEQYAAEQCITVLKAIQRVASAPYQVIHRGEPGITGTRDEIVAWAQFHNMQYGGPLVECGFANFQVKRLDGTPLSRDEDAHFARTCHHKGMTEVLANLAMTTPPAVAPKARQRSWRTWSSQPWR